MTDNKNDNNNFPVKKEKPDQEARPPKVVEEEYPEIPVVIRVTEEEFVPKKKKKIRVDRHQREKLSPEDSYEVQEVPQYPVSNVQHLRKNYVEIEDKEYGQRFRKVQLFRTARGKHNKNVQSKHSRTEFQNYLRKSKQRFSVITTKQKEKEKKVREIRVRQTINARKYKTIDRLFQREELILGRKRIEKMQRENKERTERQTKQRNKILSKTIKTKREENFQVEELNSIILEDLPKSEKTQLLRKCRIVEFSTRYKKEREQEKREDEKEQRVENSIRLEKEEVVSKQLEQKEVKKEIHFSSTTEYLDFQQYHQWGEDGEYSIENQKIHICDFRVQYRKNKVRGEPRSLVGLKSERKKFQKPKKRAFSVIKPKIDRSPKVRPRPDPLLKYKGKRNNLREDSKLEEERPKIKRKRFVPYDEVKRDKDLKKAYLVGKYASKKKRRKKQKKVMK